MNNSLDPDDWQKTRKAAHDILDAALDKMQSAGDGPVWQPMPEAARQGFELPLPKEGAAVDDLQASLQALLPYGVGNTHPRFFGWVHGAGTTTGLIADIAASSMNANLGGRDHGAMVVEQQIISWMREMFRFPDSASGLVVSGTSMATIIAIKAARDAQLIYARKRGLEAAPLIGYASNQAHNCVARAFDMLGLGSDNLRAVPVNDAYEMDLDTLNNMLANDIAAGLKPFLLVGTAGTVNVGAIDDIQGLADIAKDQNLWLHIDGAFGAAGIISQTLRSRLSAISRAQSLAFDFHKWLHVNYDAGFVMISTEADHRNAFSSRPDYLQAAERGLAAGNPWPVEYGPELSRGFRALKIWAQFTEHGTEKLGEMIDKNCAQAQHLAALISEHPKLNLLAPVATSVVCFRYGNNDELNREIVMQLQEGGVAAPSITTLNHQAAIRVNITNHRTSMNDLDMLVAEVERIALKLLNQPPEVS